MKRVQSEEPSPMFTAPRVHLANFSLWLPPQLANWRGNRRHNWLNSLLLGAASWTSAGVRLSWEMKG